MNVCLNPQILQDVQAWMVDELDDLTKKELLMSQEYEYQAFTIPNASLPGHGTKLLAQRIRELARDSRAVAWGNKQLAEALDAYLQAEGRALTHPWLIQVGSADTVNTLAAIMGYGQQAAARYGESLWELERKQRTLDWYLLYRLQCGARSLVHHLDQVARQRQQVILHTPFQCQVSRDAGEISITCWCDYTAIIQPTIDVPMPPEAHRGSLRNRRHRRVIDATAIQD